MEAQHQFMKLKISAAKTKHTAEELPKGYSPYSSAAYYNAANAKEIKIHLDQLDPNNKVKEIVFKVDKYKTVNTKYQQIYQGWRWLMEREDTTDRKYLNLRKQMSIRREKDRVRVYWNSRCKPTLNGVIVTLEGLDVSMETDDTLNISWKDSIIKWATEAEEGSVEELKLSLLPDEQNWLRDYLSVFPSVVIIRCDAAGYKITKNAKLAAAIREERGE